jgi:hypothetical protein
MANYVLDKGFLTTGSSAYAFGEIGIVAADGVSVARASAAISGVGVAVVIQENLDVAKVLTGKAVIDCRVLGIARVLCASAAVVVPGNRITSNASAQGIVQASTLAGPLPTLGVAMSAKSAGNVGFVEVLLVPGAIY